ncbi:MAG: hypothetical protein M3R14_00130 [Acidobacteriota bacterium]|nr:hypothetical protein [Acidobacteriota bacterium]
MYCPNCGTAEQSENTYCRSCGELLPDLSKKNKFAFGGNTPEQQIVKAFESAQTKELLNEANLDNAVPTSITENTTKHLSEKISRKSS